MLPQISIIFVYFNTPKELLHAIGSIKNAIGKLSYEIIIVDNASLVSLPAKIKQNKKVKIIKNEINIGYGTAINRGSKAARGKYLLISNPDIFLEKDSINRLYKKIKNDSKIGIVGPQILDEERKIRSSISGFPKLPDALFAFSFINKLFPNNRYSKKYWLLDLDRKKEQEIDVLSGACMLIKKDLFTKVKGFDERFFMYFEESDICFKVKQNGYKIIYFPRAKIIHYIGASNRDKEWIQEKFEESRFKFFKKYHSFPAAYLGELSLRLSKHKSLILLALLSFSLFLNLYKIDSLMMFYGDFGRDYLAARDMLFSGKIPLVGIQSSVTWLHQGPLSIYLISLAFLLGKFNPIVPAILYGIIGMFATYIVYLLGKNFFNSSIGLLASAFLSTSPLVVVSTRMPYHTSSIPFFAGIFFLLLYKSLLNKKYYPWMFFFLGLLLLLELSNGVLVFLLLILYVLFRKDVDTRYLLKSFPAFLLAVSPFIIYDITHNFVQTLGFPLWVINRIRLFFGLTISGNPTTGHVPSAFSTIFQQISSVIFPAYIPVVIALLVVTILLLISRKERIITYKKNIGLLLIVLWISIPLLGYAIHAAPGTAYFPLVFPAISLLVAYTFYYLICRTKLFMIVFIILIFLNAFYTIKNNYFLTAKHSITRPSLVGYQFGFDLPLRGSVAEYIVKDAKGGTFAVEPGGFLSQFQTGVDNYKYLIWYKGGNIQEIAKKKYIIYEDKNEIPKHSNVIYRNKYIFVVKK